ncbi:glutathione synthase [Desulforhopalus singaporensis]|uniref:Glutathione synthase n=2 Tax=Desulforhopalus singaporensis TaxID=91360 RepID=A0A1H0QBB0_9BACT|nr:glutathione synthase [Desulforhopalus singaporensis]
MKWLVVLDPIEGLIATTDTSIALINEGRRQEITVDTATIENLFFDSCASVLAEDLKNRKTRRRLADYDLILMRKEPPYDLRFHYASQLLSLSGTRVINSPLALRNFNEKLIALPFVDHMPPTLVASSPELIAEFVDAHGHCVIKSLDSFQGKSVQQLKVGDQTAIDEMTACGGQPVMVQKFLDRVYQGDKRVIMLGDRVLGAAMRRPRQGFHANFANSDALKTELTDREQQIVDQVGPWMVDQGIHFSGLDFIGEKLTEINITCPTGIIQISDLDNRNLAGEIVDYFIRQVQ